MTALCVNRSFPKSQQMDRLRCLQVFAEVARQNSFTLAATRLSMSRAAVTKQVAWLERSLGAQLLKRTTKRISLTDAGLRLLSNGLPLLAHYAALEDDVKDSISEPRGILRVSAPVTFGTEHLSTLAVQFCNRHPHIQIAIAVDDGRSSPLVDGLDVTIRFATALEDASYIAIPLVRVAQMLVASPDYLRRAGRPDSVRELTRHNCLVHTVKSPTGEWRFKGVDGPVAVRVRGTLCASFGDALKNAALAGHGISMHPIYMVERDLAAGRLVVVLPAVPPLPLEMTAIYSSRRHLPGRVNLFLEFLREWAATSPAWATRIHALGARPTDEPHVERREHGQWVIP